MRKLKYVYHVAYYYMDYDKNTGIKTVRTTSGKKISYNMNNKVVIVNEYGAKNISSVTAGSRLI